MISIESKKRAAMVANAVPSTEPIEKLGMMTRPAPRAATRRSRSRCGRSTSPRCRRARLMPWSTANVDDAGADGRQRDVDERRRRRASPRAALASRARATSSKSSASFDEPDGDGPTLPVAPTTATGSHPTNLPAAPARDPCPASASPSQPQNTLGRWCICRAAVDGCDGPPLLTEYFAERAASFPASQGAYRTNVPRPAQFVPPAGVFLLVVRRRRRAGRLRRGAGAQRAAVRRRAGDPGRALRGQAPVGAAGEPRSGARPRAARRARAPGPRVRRHRARARHERQPRGRGRALPVARLRATSSRTTTTRTRRNWYGKTRSVIARAPV